MTEQELLQVIEQAAIKGVTELDLSGNRLTALPPEIGQLVNLRSLNLWGNRLRSLPGELGQLVNLQSLNLYNNRLRSLPGEFGQLVNLQSLNLYNNQLRSLPGEFVQLVNLQTLDLDRNELSSLPGEFVQLVNLQTLDLGRNELSSLPREFVQLVNLQTLDLGSNQLSTLPEEFGQLVNLQTLDLGSNQLSTLPGEFVQLVNLQTLDLSDNQLSTLPGEIGQLVNLQTLYLGSNQLSTLPEEIGQLVNLQILYLGKNQLSTLPGEIGQLVNLQALDLSFNQLSSLPGEIGQLVNLRLLNLWGNQLSSLPGEIGQLVNLQTLDLEGNELITLPPEIRRNGLRAILNFYKQQLEQESEDLYEAKFLIVGEGGAGKTSLANKIQNETYELQPDEKSTEGIEVFRWDFRQPNGKDFRVNIWDFGGQEIYHQTHQFFLTKRSVYALVADTRKENTDFYWWLKVVELLSDNSPVLIIKNEKQDRQCEVNERELRGEFTNLEKVLATNLATNRGLPEIKQAIQDYISKLKHVGTPLPKLWVKVRSALENDSRNYIESHEYEKLCRDHKLTDRKDMLVLSGYLHDLGVCLHFQDDSTLKNYVILKPEWGTTAVYKVLDNENVVKNLGCFTQDNLKDIWKDDEYADMRDELLQLMMRFKLCYPIPNNPSNYIAPQLLDINQPDYTWEKSNNLILRYKYEFMPKGIITRFIVETHPWIEQQKLVWRSGVVLNKDQTRAEVIENYNLKEIKIRVTGNRKKELLAVVTHELEKIHKSFERLQYNTLVPCNCQSCEGSTTPYSYPLENLYKRLKAGRYQIQCENSYQMVDVRSLIDDVNLQPLEANSKPNVQVDQLQRELDNQRKELLTNPEEKRRMNRSLQTEVDKEIFISYAWGGESEEFVNHLDQTLQAKGIKIIRDKRNLGYKGLIQAFMERIGRGKCVIAVISDKYLKSPNCMFELVQVAKNGEFYDRIFPIVLADAQIYKGTERIKYIKHWENEIQALDNAMKEVGAANLQGIREEIDQYTDIRNTIAGLTNLLKDMNTLTPDIHQQSEFEELINGIEYRLNQDTISQHPGSEKELKPHTAHSQKELAQATNKPSVQEPSNKNQPNINYHDFQILVTSDRKIRASSEQGDERGELRLEMNDIELALELIESRKTNAKLLKRLGSQLYQALFPTKIHGRLQATIAGAQANNYEVRLRLVFDSPELAALPWEFLYDEATNTFLGNNTQTVLSRYVDVPLQKRDIKAASLPLKVLLVISSPSNLAKLDVAGEENLIRDALQKHIDAGKIELDVLPDATIRNINQKLREKPYNVFHFIGHGKFENNKGYIALVDTDGKYKLLDDEGFGNFFLGNSSLGLAVLNSCQGAVVSDNQAFAGIAPNLVRRGIPAVVAMQYEVLDTTAKLFADEFYRTLALGWPVDAAMQTTRNAISMEVGLNKPDFATPVLYMRAKDGIILSGLSR
ncbi:Miro domain-containing protein [Calothrix sp. NIES-2100]|uniref:leucine-rich repeat domain-containing protein n=1 Tax=Calothrix sp. NIES-2100 TaxID=1954172 RepID=UPI000B5E95FA|nr:Miro domain-containing protein [Calothrix sp. NIES-2100]